MRYYCRVWSAVIISLSLFALYSHIQIKLEELAIFREVHINKSDILNIKYTPHAYQTAGEIGNGSVDTSRPIDIKTSSGSTFDEAMSIPINSNAQSNPKEHFRFIVMVLSHMKKNRLMAKKYWLNEMFWRSRNVSIKMLFVVGKDQLNNHSENDLIFTSVTEAKYNLVFKVKEGMRYIYNNYAFDYILKTDDDVFHNFRLWQDKLLEYNSKFPENIVIYGGGWCKGHKNVAYRWCSGLGYVVHRSVVQKLVQYPKYLMEAAEDRNTGKFMQESSIKITQFVSARLTFSKSLCEHLNDILRSTASVHLGFGSVRGEKQLECWNSTDKEIL